MGVPKAFGLRRTVACKLEGNGRPTSVGDGDAVNCFAGSETISLWSEARSAVGVAPSFSRGVGPRKAARSYLFAKPVYSGSDGSLLVRISSACRDYLDVGIAGAGWLAF